MCGINGILSKRVNQEELLKKIGLMNGSISHRGPDGEGHWINEEKNCVLGHRRLAIIDLSINGKQPITSMNGRYTMTFNGEIYNFLDLKEKIHRDFGELSWRSTTDTEVFLEAISLYGLDSSLQMAQGMFALAIWDKETHSLYIARDRFGEKPLYYGKLGDSIVFSSELKSICNAFPEWDKKVNPESVSLFLKHGYINYPHTIYQNIFKLPPATSLQIQEKNFFDFQPKAYWTPKISMEDKIDLSYEEALEGLDRKLNQSVKGQMISDVSIGAFLSGGIDSSIVSYYLSKNSSKAIQTFTIGFEDQVYDESIYAKQIADYLGADHQCVQLTNKELKDVVPQIANVYDEPFADASQIPSILLCKYARENIQVALSGDGADEIFAGYTRYGLHKKLFHKINRMPYSLRHSVNHMTQLVPNAFIDTLCSFKAEDMKKYSHEVKVANKIKKVASTLSYKNEKEFYLQMNSFWKQGLPLKKGVSSISLFKDDFLEDKLSIDDILFIDTISYLPEDILTKMDRASMHSSLETRCPFLSPDLYEYVRSLPNSYYFKDGVGKRCLKDLAYQLLPKDLLERPKKGFSVPIARWLRGELKAWAEDLINSKANGPIYSLVDKNKITKKWEEHISQKADWHNELWPFLQLKAWEIEYL